MRIALSLATICMAFAVHAQDGPPVLPPDFDLDGRTAADLSAEWWQWAQSIPASVNPVRDTVGTHCAQKQNGDVWFLAGGFGTSRISRTCTVPYGKYLFFPAVNMSYWARATETRVTCDAVKRGAAVNNATALKIFVEVDGVVLEEPEQHRARTEECFDVFARIPANQRPAGGDPAASDGFWYLLEPLPRGKHEIRFGGRYNSTGDSFGQMVQDIEYILVVE